MNITRKIMALALIAVFSCCFAPAARCDDEVQQPNDVFNNFSDVLIFIMPTFALGMTLGAKDAEGALQFGESVGVAMGITVSLKYSVTATRPNGDPRSFPSGHTAITVTSAEFLRRRYGWKYGAPAYAVAAYVGYDRVRTDEHYIRDVVGGAVIAFVSTYLITKPNKAWRMQAVVNRNEQGIRLTRVF